MTPDLGAGPLDPGPRDRSGFIERPPHRRRRRDRAEHTLLMAQGVDVGDRFTASSQHRGHIQPDLTTGMTRDETTSGQRDGQAISQADPIGHKR